MALPTKVALHPHVPFCWERSSFSGIPSSDLLLPHFCKHCSFHFCMNMTYWRAFGPLLFQDFGPPHVSFIVGNVALLLESPPVIFFSPTFANIVPSIFAWIWPVGRNLALLFVMLGLTISRPVRVSALVMAEARSFCQMDLLPCLQE